jgi:hypothetical protein
MEHIGSRAGSGNHGDWDGRWRASGSDQCLGLVAVNSEPSPSMNRIVTVTWIGDLGQRSTRHFRNPRGNPPASPLVLHFRGPVGVDRRGTARSARIGAACCGRGGAARGTVTGSTARSLPRRKGGYGSVIGPEKRSKESGGEAGARDSWLAQSPRRRRRHLCTSTSTSTSLAPKAPAPLAGYQYYEESMRPVVGVMYPHRPNSRMRGRCSRYCRR